MRSRSRMSLISGRFHTLASKRPTLPRPQLSLSQTWLAVYPFLIRNSVRRRASRRLATVAPYTSVTRALLLDRASRSAYALLNCESQKLSAPRHSGQTLAGGMPETHSGQASRGIGSVGGVVELATLGAVHETLPLVPVVHQNQAGGIAGDAHQYPRLAQRLHEGDLDRARAVAGPLPGLHTNVDPQLVDTGLGDAGQGLASAGHG